MLLNIFSGQITGDLRLFSKVGLSSSNYNISEGRLDIYRNHQWGTVCSSFFGRLEAEVACRQLGFIRSQSYGTVVEFGYDIRTFT